MLLACLLGGPAAGAAQPAQVRLLYSRGEGAALCPDEQSLRESVAARLGYDPFAEKAETTVAATLTGDSHGLRAHVELLDVRGRVTGSRLLTTARKDCQELSATMALAICIAIDPLVLSRPPPEADPGPSAPLPHAEPCPACPACPKPMPGSAPVPAPPSWPVLFRVGAGLQADLGAVPTLVSLGVVVQAQLRYRAFALALEGRVDPYLGSARVGMGGGVGATLVLGLVAPCARYRFVGFCAVLGLGALQGRSVDLAFPNQASTFYAQAGARLSFEVPLHRRLALDLHLDGATPLTRTTLTVDGAEAWSTPALSGALGGNLQLLIP